jgi:FtsP/CotA-like multicopper oxidase with cupredoxin domain
MRSRSVTSLTTTFIVLAMLAGALAPAVSGVRGAQSTQVPLSGGEIPQFVDPLPMLDVAGGSIRTLDGTGSLTIRMCEFRARVLPSTFIPAGDSAPAATWVWGYLADTTGDPTTTCAQLVAAASDGSGIVDSYIGPVILAQRGTPTRVTWINNLGSTATTHVDAYRYSTDQTLHWADPNDLGCAMTEQEPPTSDSPCAQNYSGSIPAAAHLHGGEVPAAIDGGPDSWFTADGSSKGHAYYTQTASDAPNTAVYRYPNVQQAAPLWFHDHTLGATRLNVYAGLAGAYLLADPGATLPAGLAAYGLQRGSVFAPTVPLVIQDRMFDTNGQLFFPADSAAGTLWSPNPDHPYWVPEFIGDTIVVNGKAWPYLNVEPKRYRFLFLNGSNARAYDMSLVDPVSKNDGPAIWVIGTDGGYLDAPVRIDPAAPRATDRKLLMMPGERYEAIIDFGGFGAGRVGPNGQRYSGQWVLQNVARAPYPSGDPAQGNTTGRIMKFIVGACESGQCGASDSSYNPASRTPLRTPMVRLANPATGTLAATAHAERTRVLTLNEVIAGGQTATDPATGQTTKYEGGPLEVLLNNTEFPGGESPRPYDDFTPVTTGGVTTYYSELPREGDTEVWEIVNTTADAHPIHLHLVQFQLINRQSYNTNAWTKAYDAAFPSGSYTAAFGPPKDYRAARNPLSGGKDGGNPDIDAVRANGKPMYLQGPASPPRAAEAGWKDTIVVPPGAVTRIAVRWAPTDLPASTSAADGYFPFSPDGGHGYVWHCHIIDHEDNEMMRPLSVQPNANPVLHRTYLQGIDF